MSASTEPISTRAPRGPDVGPPTTLVLLRHGRTIMTEQQRMAGGGSAFDPSLSADGRADAERARAVLGDLLGGPLTGHVAPSLVVTSPMARTRETAEVIAGSFGLPVEVDRGFIENDYGHWDGLTYAEIIERWPQEMRAWQGSSSYAPPGGESLDDHVVRVDAARDRVIAAQPGKVVVVVSHVTPIRAMLRTALDAGVAAMWRIRVDPCSVSITRHWSDGNAEVGCMNRVG